MAATRVITDHETTQGHNVQDVDEQSLGCDVTSPDSQPGEPRLIGGKGLAVPGGNMLLPPNERCLAKDGHDCYRRQVVTNGGDDPES